MTLAAAQVHSESMAKEWEQLDKDTKRDREVKLKMQTHTGARPRSYVGDFIVPATAKKKFMCMLFFLESIIICGHRNEEKKGPLVYLCLCLCVRVHVFLFN